MAVIFIPWILGCGQAPSGEVRVDPMFLEYLQEFEASTGVDTAGVSVIDVSLGEIQGETIYAHCDRPTKTIEIDTSKVMWKVSREHREYLIYHELGHCLRNLNHDSSVDSDNTPASLMFPSPIAESVWNRKKSQFIQQSFDH